MEIRRARKSDLSELFELYSGFSSSAACEANECAEAVWEKIEQYEGYHILVGCEDGRIVSTCAVTILPNLTHGQKPYAWVENVITKEAYQNRGYASSLLKRAEELAREAGCYRIGLMTRSKKESTWKFYESAGYNSEDKKAFVMWLE